MNKLKKQAKNLSKNIKILKHVRFYREMKNRKPLFSSLFSLG